MQNNQTEQNNSTQQPTKTIQSLYSLFVMLNLFQHLILCEPCVVILSLSKDFAVFAVKTKKIRINPFNLCHPCSKNFALANKKQPNE